jgi:hypothetical protein
MGNPSKTMVLMSQREPTASFTKLCITSPETATRLRKSRRWEVIPIKPINRREERMMLLPNCYARIGRLLIEFGSDLEDAGAAAEGVGRVVEQGVADRYVSLHVA